MVKNWDELSKCGERVISSFALTSLKLGSYVRVRPPDQSECEDVKKDSRFLKFLRVGVKVEITDLGDALVVTSWCGIKKTFNERSFV